MAETPPSKVRNVLLATATITPPADCPRLVRSDPAERANDYKKALTFYLTLLPSTIDRIVFVENSRSDLSELQRLVSSAGQENNVEFVSFYGLDYPPEHGRGYGEFALLDYAMSNSAVLTALPNPARVWKITGRYLVKNLPTMLRTAPREYGLYCDLKDRPMPWMDLRLFSFTSEGYERLLRGAYRRVSEAEHRKPAEVPMRHYIGSLLGQEKIVPRFRSEPMVDGVRGVDGRNYFAGRNTGKYLIRAMARKVAPFLWI